MSTLDVQPLGEDVRERVLVAANDELIRWGIDRFSIVSLCDRHGLDADLIRQHWASDKRLILDALVSWPNRELTLPDSGSLRADLYMLATGMARYLSSPIGRNLQSTHLIENPALPSTQIRRDAWRARADSLRIVIDRARQRGEVITQVDDFTILELLLAPINMRALFTHETVDDDYCRTISDLVWRAISRNAGSGTPDS